MKAKRITTAQQLLQNDREWKAKFDYRKDRADAAEEREQVLREALEHCGHALHARDDSDPLLARIAAALSAHKEGD